MGKSINKEILVDFSDMKSMNKADRQKSRLENLGYSILDTRQMGVDKFKMTYGKRR